MSLDYIVDSIQAMFPNGDVVDMTQVTLKASDEVKYH